MKSINVTESVTFLPFLHNDAPPPLDMGKAYISKASVIPSGPANSQRIMTFMSSIISFETKEETTYIVCLSRNSLSIHMPENVTLISNKYE
jgi:hypothetical protein